MRLEKNIFDFFTFNSEENKRKANEPKTNQGHDENPQDGLTSRAM